VSERDVDAAIRGGARSLDEVASACGGAGTDCGTCRGEIEERLGQRCTGRCADCSRNVATLASAGH
jgi:bacterioferritin-associated ferredoxin